jgi:signal transduction histidine kinase
MASLQTTKSLDWLMSMSNPSVERTVPKKLWAFAVAIVTTAVALAIDVLLGTFAAEATDALYIMASAASAYVGGWRFGFLSVALGLLPNVGLYNSSHYSLAIGAYGWEHILVSTGIAAVLAWLVGCLHTQQIELQKLNHDLEQRVHQRTADLEESNRQLEAFSYTLAHDLRAPLRAIQGFSQITLAENSETISADGKQTLTRIGNSAEMMGRLIHDLLTYTQLHRSEIPLAKTNLQEVVDRVLQILAPEIRDKNARIEVPIPLPTVTTNFVLIEQILLSLVSNALKFRRENVAPHVRIWAEPGGGSVRLTIQDNGIGIAARHIDRIFQPFQRLDVKTSNDGTGMGLALAKKSIERLGGKIGVDSQLNVGTRFWLELPQWM